MRDIFKTMPLGNTLHRAFDPETQEQFQNLIGTY